MHDKTFNGCWQRLLSTRQLIPRKCNLCSQGIWFFYVGQEIIAKQSRVSEPARLRSLRRCVIAVFFILFIMPITRPHLLSMELETLLVNDQVTASCQTNMPPKHYIKSYKQQK